MTARPTDRRPAAEWVYRGTWRALAEWFRVPETPPDLPAPEGETVRAFHPARGYLRMLRMWFWIGWTLIAGTLATAWVGVTIAAPLAGALVALPAAVVVLGGGAISYLALHLRYDCTWYVMSPRSLRVRRGIWVIVEQTITFENVQNVNVSRGPIEQLFGIATLRVSTAGGGRSSGEGGSSPNTALLAGVENPADLRTMIMERVRASRSAGLGDEESGRAGGARLTGEHIARLREIRDAVAALA